MKPRESIRRAALAALFATALGACIDEKIVFRDRELFNPPADSLNGFLGYFDYAKKTTTCGNCHVEKQAQWVNTGHADAWKDLAGSGEQKDYCNACHTVSEKGNSTAAKAGYSAVADSAYHDVQCESCHGPGFIHVQSPGLTNLPLAKVNIPKDSAAWDTSATCASCHSGVHTPYVDQWAASAHAGVVEEVINNYLTNPTTYTSCLACHEGRSTLKAWGVKTNYIEKDQAINQTTAMPVACAVCHDPHAADNPGQLRWPIDDPNPDNQLCMKCHNRRTEPQATSYRGPHAPQGGVLLGTAGWWPPDYDTTALVATHGNAAVNKKLCAQCHVARLTVNDQATGKLTFQSTGHLFLPDPCLNAQGIPTADQSCRRPGDAGYTSGTRAFTGCVTSGCHSSAAGAENAFRANRDVLKILADLLWVDTDGDQVMVVYGSNRIGQSFDPGDTGLLTRVPLTEYNYGDNRIKVAEGALFNVQLVGELRYVNGDGSYGAHNPFLAQAILSASINAVKATYGLSVPQEVQKILDEIDQKLPSTRTKPVVQTSSR